MDRNERDSNSQRMLGDTDDSSFDSARATLMEEFPSPGSFRVVGADQVQVSVARPRPEDTSNMRRRESVLFSLFPDSTPEGHRVNPRVKAAEWSDNNPLFVSKLLASPPI